MQIEMTLIESDGILRVDLQGHRDAKQAISQATSIWPRVAAECRARNIYRILAISQLTGRLPPLSAYAISSNPQQFNWDRNFQLAFVDLNPESLADNQFGELVATNRGWSMKVFDNEQDAMTWLNGAGGNVAADLPDSF